MNREYYIIERVLVRLIENEKAIEKAKIPITSNVNFNSFEIFELIKSRGQAYFTSLDVSKLLTYLTFLVKKFFASSWILKYFLFRI